MPERNNLGLILVVVTGLTGAFMVQTVRTPAVAPVAVPPAASKDTPASNQPAPPQRSALHPFAEFLGIPVPSASPNPATERNLLQELQPALQQQLNQEVGSLDFLIYLVTDPIDAQANYRFDQQIDALHKALGAEKFIPDRYYLPWKKDDKFRRHLQEPGVILFRRNGPSTAQPADRQPYSLTDLVVVFLVGETTTAGVHPEAFARAAHYQQALRELVPGRPGFFVCGPVFSGSADSLARALRRLRDPEGNLPAVAVFTGQAISLDRERFRSLSGGAEIFATVLPGDVLKEALIQHVAERNWNCSRIAWLTETGTGYGSSISFHGPQNSRPSPTPTAPGLPEVIEFPFPANIAQVRAAYDEARRKDSKSKDSLGAAQPRLSIPFAATDAPADLVPPLTTDVTAPTAELILAQILSTIRNQHIKFVGISFTDPRDPLFIAAMIKEQCPNVQIMLVTSDVLHLHPEYSRIMHGSLVASSYPLYPEALTWCFPYGEHLQADDSADPAAEQQASRNTVLSSHSSYGVYNALVLLRGVQTDRFQLQPNHSAAKLKKIKPDTASGDNTVALPLCYGAPFQIHERKKQTSYRPAVWISRIGRSSFHPITAHRTDPPDLFSKEQADERAAQRAAYTLTLQIDANQAVPRQHVHTRVPLSLTMLAFLWIVGGGLHLLILLRNSLLLLALRRLGFRIKKRQWNLGKWCQPMIIGRGGPVELRGLQLTFRSLGTACFIVMLGLLGSIQLAALQPSGDDWITAMLCCICYLLAACFQVLLVFDLADSFPWGRRDAARSSELGGRLVFARVLGVIVILGALAGFAAVALLQIASWQHYAADAYLWYSTAADIWNGLSFLTTAQLPCIAILALAYGIMVQLHLLSKDQALLLPRQITTDEERSPQRLRDALLFPVLSRFRQGKPVALSFLIVVIVFAWLAYLWTETQGPDFFASKVNFPCILWLLATGFWFLRFFKLVHILQGFCTTLQAFGGRLNTQWPDWKTMFLDAGVQKNGLEELLWRRDAYTNEYRARLANVRNPREECAQEVDLFVRRMFFHFGRLMAGLVVAGCLLFLAAQSFPLSSEPLLRLTASAMLGATGVLIVWYYIKFDRDELLSYLVGTDAKTVAWNWSMLQSIAPGVLLAAIACVSQVFPEVWQWLRYIAEPLARSSS